MICTRSCLPPIIMPFMAWIAAWADMELSKDTNPKHLLFIVLLSMNTLADMTLPGTDVATNDGVEREGGGS